MEKASFPSKRWLKLHSVFFWPRFFQDGSKIHRGKRGNYNSGRSSRPRVCCWWGPRPGRNARWTREKEAGEEVGAQRNRNAASKRSSCQQRLVGARLLNFDQVGTADARRTRAGEKNPSTFSPFLHHWIIDALFVDQELWTKQPVW